MTIHEHLVDVLCRNAGLDLAAAAKVQAALVTGRMSQAKTTAALAEVRRCEPVRPVPAVVEQMQMALERKTWIQRLAMRLKGRKAA